MIILHFDLQPDSNIWIISYKLHITFVPCFELLITSRDFLEVFRAQAAILKIAVEKALGRRLSQPTKIERLGSSVITVMASFMWFVVEVVATALWRQEKL